MFQDGTGITAIDADENIEADTMVDKDTMADKDWTSQQLISA